MIPTKERSIKQTLTFFTFTSLAIFCVAFTFALSCAYLYFCPHSEPQRWFPGGKSVARRAPNSRGKSCSELAALSPSTRPCGAVSVRHPVTWGHLHVVAVALSPAVSPLFGSIDRGLSPAKKKDTEPTGTDLGVFSAPSQQCWCRPQVACSLLWVEVMAVYENTEVGKRY